MKVLKLEYITEKGREAINKENAKNKKNWKLRTSIKLTGGNLLFLDGAMEFQHFSFRMMPGDLNSPGNKQSEKMKRDGFKNIEESLAKYDCKLDVDYKVGFIEVF